MKSTIIITSIGAALLSGLVPCQSTFADPCDNPQFAATRIPGVGTLRASGGSVSSVVIAELNGDAHTDLAAVISGCALCTPPIPDNLSVLLGNGDGTFESPVNYSIGEFPAYLSAGDLTGDTRPELVVSFLAKTNVSLFVNNGNGTFQAPTSIGFANITSGARLLDMNDDGNLDLASSAAQVALGNGNGTFQSPITFPNPAANVLVATGDFDGNGTEDIAFPGLDLFNDQPFIYSVVGTTSATFQTLTNSPVSVVFISLAAGDLNGDTFPDVVGATGSNTVSVCLNKGDGTFHPNVDYPVLTNSSLVLVADLDGNDDPDVVVRTSDFTIVILLGNGDGTLQDGINYSYDGHAIPTSLTVGDINGDGIPDIAGAGTGEALGIPILLGNGDGTFQAAPKYPTGDGPLSPQAGDFNGDGLLDLVVANNFSNNVSLFLNNGDGTFGSSVEYLAGKNAESIAIADFNNDGTNDIAVANQNTNVVSLLLGKGDGTFFNTTTVGPVVVGSGSVLAGLFDGDTNADVIVVGMSTNFQAGVLMFHGTGFGTFATPLVSAGPTVGDKLAAGLFNSDTNLDLVVGKTGQNVVQTMLGNGDGTFQSPVNYNVGTNVSSVAVGDFNDDTNADIVVAQLGCNPCTNTFVNGSISVLLGNGDGTFQDAVTYEVSAAEQMFAVKTADFNGDGIDDVAVTSSLGTLWVLVSNGDGTFRPGVQFGVQNTPSSLVVADLDGDGRPDLATANKAVDTISVLINSCLFDVVGPPTNTANLALFKTDTPDPVIVDSNITYTLVITNLGTVTASSVTVTDALPATVSFVSASAGCTNIGSNVICSIGDLASGASATRTIVVNTTLIGVITNTASVSSTTDDPNLANNTSQAITTVTGIQTDLAVTKSGSPDPVTAGSNLTYTVTVTNKGPTTATSVTLTDTLPSSATFLSASPGCTNNGGTVTCDLGDLGNGTSTSVEIVVTPGTAGSVTNSVTVAAEEADPVAGDNSATAITAVQQPGGGGGDLTGTLSKVKDKCKTKKGVTTCKLGASLDLLNESANPVPPMHVRFFLSTDAIYDAMVDSFLGEATTKAIKPGKKGKAKLKTVTNASSDGQFILVVDDDDNVLDSLQVPAP